jgi:hypothetical protein
MQFEINERERRLVAAAIALGDWLAAYRETSRKQRKIIEKMRQALRGLPAVPAGVEAEYGFHFRTLEGTSILYRAWRVSLSPAGLEIYSVYTPDQQIPLPEKMSHELNFWIKPGESSGHDGRYLDEWIAEVRDPAALRNGALEFAVYAENY